MSPSPDGHVGPQPRSQTPTSQVPQKQLTSAPTTAQPGLKIPYPFKHPLDPLTATEITSISHAVRTHLLEATPDVRAIKFITCALVPPPKKDVLAHLGILSSGEAEEKGKGQVELVRMAEVDFLDLIHGRSYNAVISFISAQWKVTNLNILDSSLHPQISPEELTSCEEVVRAHPTIQAICKSIGVEPDQIYCDGWSIGYDERFPQARRVQQALVFARYGTHENLYAHPLDFVPVVDVHTGELLHVDWSPHYVVDEQTGKPKLEVGDTAPLPTLDPNTEGPAHRARIPPPQKRWDFLPDMIQESGDDVEYKTPRKGLKPLHITQPEGVSFKMDGNELEWQNWKMHISFTHREGIALSTITYNDHGVVRPIFYRLSLAEMVVPYGAPEYPHPRKFAFDSGEYGMGTMANELSLGCDCLGQIHYLPGVYMSQDGSPFTIDNVICIHEEDSGVLWKHADYRPGGRTQTVRRRRLVVSMVCTLANYEYIWNYHFYQDGSVEFEIRLTGILNVYVARDGEPSPYGTIVAPGINAHLHQHMFSVRVDPMLDGLDNAVVESDIVSLPYPTGSKENYAGNGFRVEERRVDEESGRDSEWSKERRWKVINPNKRHYASGKPIGYSIHLKGGATPLFGQPDSWTAARAGVLKHPIWVTKDVEDRVNGGGSLRMWPAGKYVPQTRSQPEDSVPSWVENGQQLDVEKGEDVLVWLTVGTTHVPRPEDWPVMPAETLSVMFKPNGFFGCNPSMDVPGLKDACSVPASMLGGAASTGNDCCGTD